MNETGNKQIEYINLIRITAIILVIALHAVSPYYINTENFNTRTWWACIAINSVSRAGVPLFLMISGYLLLNSPKTLEFASFYKSRIAKVIIPFIIWSVIYYVYKSVMAGQEFNIGLIKKFFDELLNRGTYYHLWFIYTIIGAYLIAPFLKRMVDNCNTKQLAGLFLLIILTSSFIRFINIATPMNIYLFDPLINGYITFFILGYILGKADLSRKIRIAIHIAGIIGIFISIFGNYKSSSNEKINLLFNEGAAINHYMIASAVFVLFKNMKIRNNRLSGIVSHISPLVFGVYFAHALVMDLADRLFSFTPAVMIVFSFLIAVLASFLLALIISKIKYVRKALL